MAKIKLTKTELKTQKDALARFRRFLPMLQLKKQQLQLEIVHIDVFLDEIETRRVAAEKALRKWVKLFAEPGAPALETLCALTEIRVEPGNIAGVKIPVFKSVMLDQPEQDPWLTPAWVDDAQAALANLLTLRAKAGVFEAQRALVAEELLTTSQRVNLFEKIKIPQCRENIRVITIALGDEQTAGVIRGKIAKSRNTGAAA